MSSNSNSLIAPQATVPAGPAVQHFSFTDEILAVIDGAGCGYSAPGVVGDSSLFASSSDAVIRVGGKLQILKPIGDGTYTDSTSESRYENAAYRVDLRTVTDSAVESGSAQHGEMTVEDKTSGGKTTLALVGGCGC